MIYPVQDYKDKWYIAQGFGNKTTYGFHEGVDLNLKTGGDTDLGQELKSIAIGSITYYHYGTHTTTGFGRHIVYRIDGPWGTRWVHYAHCLNTGFLNAPQDVPEGKVIAYLGKSGNSPSAHLHMSIFKVDPASLEGGIDIIAKTQEQLDTYWEDPITFMEKWINFSPTPQPQPCVITDQTKIPQINNMEVQAIRSKLTDQENTINNLQSKLQQIHSISG